MRQRWRRMRYFAAGTAVVLCGLLTGVVLSAMGARPLPNENVSSDPPQPRTAVLSGHITPPLQGSHEDAVIVMLRRADWSTCEDLGRQLRELRRATLRRGLPLYVFTDSASYPGLAVRVSRENIRPDTIYVVNLEAQLAGLSESATPAALHVSSAGEVVVGVAYIGSVPGYRARSFTQELGLSAR